MLPGLLFLALLDSLSVATLVIPVWFLLSHDGPRYRLVWTYLAAVTGLYWVIGLVCAALVPGLASALGRTIDSAAVDLARAGAGIGLLAFAAWFGLVHKPDPGRRGVLSRYRDAAVGADGSTRRVLALALLGVLLELPTMVPYLAALARLRDAEVGPATYAGALGLYCVVMVLPATVLVGLAAVGGQRAGGPLRRVQQWLDANAQENTAWLIAVLGFLTFSGSSYYSRLMAALG